MRLCPARSPPAHAAPALVSGWCLPLPDPEQELHCPSRCPGQRGIVLSTSSRRPPRCNELLHPNRRRCSSFKNKSRTFPFLGMAPASHLSWLRMRSRVSAGRTPGEVVLTHPRRFWVSCEPLHCGLRNPQQFRVV